MTAGAERVLAELERWRPRFERGEVRPEWGQPVLGADERFAVCVAEVRAAGLGHPTAAGTLHATDRRAVVLGTGGRAVREWDFAQLVAVSALGNWGGLTLVRAGGDTELIVTARLQDPTWQDAVGWLKVEVAFAAATGRLADWGAVLPERLAQGRPAEVRERVRQLSSSAT